VTVPTNTSAEVWVPTQGGMVVDKPDRADFVRVDGGYAVYRVASGSYTFTVAR
jgi:alpha-L-rhamnosidase